MLYLQEVRHRVPNAGIEKSPHVQLSAVRTSSQGQKVKEVNIPDNVYKYVLEQIWKKNFWKKNYGKIRRR